MSTHADKPGKNHTTNYFNTFIEVAEDTKVQAGVRPPSRGTKKTVAEMQYDLVATNPYKYTSDDLLFQIYSYQNDLTEEEQETAREEFFAKGRACLRASPLTKSYGFGIHCDSEGKIELVGMEQEKYLEYLNDPRLKKVKAMRSTRK